MANIHSRTFWFAFAIGLALTFLPYFIYPLGQALERIYHFFLSGLNSRNVLVVNFPFMILGTLLFPLNFLTPWFRKMLKGVSGVERKRFLLFDFVSFLLGIFLSYVVLTLLALFAFSQVEFGGFL